MDDRPIPVRVGGTIEERVRVLAGEGPDTSLLDRAVTFRDLVALGLITHDRAIAAATVRPAVRRRTESVSR